MADSDLPTLYGTSPLIGSLLPDDLIYMVRSDGGSPPTYSDYAAKAGQLERNFGLAASDETTAITTGNGKVTFDLIENIILTGVVATLVTAETAGSPPTPFTVDVKADGTSIFSTLLTIDGGEVSSLDAATPAVITDGASPPGTEIALAAGTSMRIDVTQIDGGTAAGLKVWFIYRLR